MVQHSDAVVILYEWYSIQMLMEEGRLSDCLLDRGSGDRGSDKMMVLSVARQQSEEYPYTGATCDAEETAAAQAVPLTLCAPLQHRATDAMLLQSSLSLY